MKIYYGTPIGLRTDKRNRLMQEDVNEITDISSFARKLGHEVFSPAESQQFISQDHMPDKVTGREFEYMKYCDVVMVKPGDPPSGGAHVQLGWASAFGKPVIILTEVNKRYSALVRGLDAITKCEYVDITKEDRFERLKIALQKTKNYLEKAKK